MIPCLSVLLRLWKRFFFNFFQSNPANYYHCKYYKRVGNFKGKQRIFIINYFVFNYFTWKSKQSIKLFSLGAMKENKQEEFLYLSKKRLGTLFTNWISQFKFLQLPMSPCYNGEQQQRIYLCAAETGWSGRESVRVGGERQLGFGGQTRYWVSQNLPQICTASA